ncbi:MAG: hypothetical protein OXH19_13545 [Chloroflexi bacterium]|nr:hypothetical protein [Chloroflexota bacterium]MCY3685602.1 hypothetical protein [Chloroflexota bacterium]MDE2708504.1 hypothetical protein [Chloroflexota bacterium]
MAVDIALATGYLDSSAREPSDVMVDSLDSSATMIRFGEAISRELLNSISWPGDESDIWSERNLVDASDWNFTEVGDFVDTWLMGLHAVYDQSIDSAQSQVAAIDELVGADCILLTTHSLKASLLRRVLPKDESSRIIRLSAAKIERESLPSMDRIKEMRMEIRRFAVGSKLPDSHSDDIALVRSYMGGVPDLFQSIDRVSCRLHAREEDQG